MCIGQSQLTLKYNKAHVLVLVVMCTRMVSSAQGMHFGQLQCTFIYNEVHVLVAMCTRIKPVLIPYSILATVGKI